MGHGDRRIANLVYEVAHANRLIADFVAELHQSGHVPAEASEKLLDALDASRKRLKQLEPKEGR